MFIGSSGMTWVLWGPAWSLITRIWPYNDLKGPSCRFVPSQARHGLLYGPTLRPCMVILWVSDLTWMTPLADIRMGPISAASEFWNGPSERDLWPPHVGIFLFCRWKWTFFKQSSPNPADFFVLLFHREVCLEPTRQCTIRREFYHPLHLGHHMILWSLTPSQTIA